jgi:hypothetical protein
MSHPLFRPCATLLLRLVRNVMPNLNCKRSGSTSAMMLEHANKYVKDVIKEQQNGETKVSSCL